MINLKELNQNIPHQHFKMEGLHYLKFTLRQGDYMWKPDLQGTYFSIPLSENSKKMVHFQWSGNLLEFLCFCFGKVTSKTYIINVGEAEYQNHIPRRYFYF